MSCPGCCGDSVEEMSGGIEIYTCRRKDWIDSVWSFIGAFESEKEDPSDCNHTSKPTVKSRQEADQGNGRWIVRIA